MNLIKEIAEHLAYEGFGTVPSTVEEGNIYYGKMPDMPDSAIAVLSVDSAYPSAPNGARIQLLFRGMEVDDTYLKAVAVVDSLLEFDGFLAGDGAKVFITVENGPTGLGADPKRRELYSVNLRVYYCET